jgi:hypothetical protein
MSHSFPTGVKILLALGLASVVAAPMPAQPPKPKQPEWSHAFDLKCRSSKQPKFDKDTKAFGVEVFRDENNGHGIYITETGVVAGVATLDKITGKSAPPAWLHGLDLKVRPAGEDSFDKAKVFGLEVFRDKNNGNWLYITETGAISTAPGTGAIKETEAPKAPKWVHGLDLKVRKGGVKEWGKDTKVWSIEVFRDENNGNLIYICESGMIAIVPGFEGAEAPTPKAKAPEWLHGLDLKVRKGGQPDFDPAKDGTTRLYGLEVFRDENNGNLIYISEAGSLAVVPNKSLLKAPTEKVSEPVWLHGLDLKVRMAGKENFDKNAPNFGVEVFNDENTACTIYICYTGAITALPKAK